MRLTMRSWTQFLERLFPRWQARWRRKRRSLRRHDRQLALQGLEPRQLLSASLQVLLNGSQLTNGGSDSFGTVTVDSSDTQYLLLENVGDATLTISSDSLPYGFSSSSWPPINVYPGQYATFPISLNTNSVASYSGPLSLSTNDPNNSNFVLNVSGTVQQSSSGGTIELFDGSTQIANGGNDFFGSVTVGSSDTKNFSVANYGSSSLTVSSVSLPSGYSLNTTLPFNVGSYQSANLSVSLNTATAGNFNGQMLIQSSDTSHNPFTVNISGTVTGSSSPAIDLKDAGTDIANGGSDSFGSVNQGSSDTRTYTVTNQGSGTLSVSAVNLPSGYSLQTSLPLNVTAGNSTTFTVALNTANTGTFTGTMALTTTDPNNNPFNVSLSGTVTAPPAPVMQLWDGPTQISNGGSDSYGSVTQGSSDNRTYTVKNTGSASLTVSAVSLPGGYSLQTSLPLSIAAGNSATFVVAMSTMAIGSYSGTMVVTDSDANNDPYNLSLSGTVTAPAAPVMSLADGSTTISNGGSDSFGSVSQGSNDTRTYTVSDTGNASLSVSAISLRSGYSLQTSLPLTVAAGSSTTFVIALDTSTAGSFNGTMSITDTDTNNDPYNVSLTGTVTSSGGPGDLPAVSIQANWPTADELTHAQGQFTVTRSGDTTNPLTVSYTVGGTATPGSDYSALSGTATVGPGSASATITVFPMTGGDVNEIQRIVLPSPTGGGYTLSIGSDTTTALPYNADAAAVAGALESLPSVGAGRVTVTGSGTSADPFVATFDAPLGGAALAQISGDGSQLVGGSSNTITTSITTVGDDGGTVVAALASSSDYTVGTPAQDTVDVIGDLPPVITVAATTPQADEVAGTPGEFTLYRNGPAIDALTVYYSLGGSTLDGVDYEWLPGSVTFAAGQATAEVDIAPIDNGLAGAAKTAVLTLTAPSPGSNSPAYALAGASSDTVTIINNNLPVATVSATTPTSDAQSGTAGEFTVTRTGDTTLPLTVNYSVGGSATAGAQYQALSGNVVIPAGQAYATIDVTPIDDADEGTSTSATVVVTLTASSAYYVAQPPSAGTDPVPGGSATVTITDDDLPQVSLAASTPLAIESTATPGAFTISIDQPQSSDLTIPYTVSGTAVSGSDFEPLSGSATVPAGQTSVVVPVAPLNDPAEFGFTTVEVTLSSASGYELTTSKTALVSIVGNMTVPTLTLDATTPVADEVAGTNGAFTVTRSGSTANALTAYYTISGTAVDGTDYDLLPGSVTIPAGQASTTILITTLADPAMQDSSRTVTLNLTNYGGPSGASYAIGAPGGGTVTIDDLPTVTVQATTASASEHAGTAGVFTVRRANDPLQASQALVVNYSVSGTAAGGNDYHALSGSVTIPAGQASATIGVTPIDVGLVGGSKTVVVTLASGGYLISSPLAPQAGGGGPSDTVTIQDDDPPVVTIQATAPTAGEATGPTGALTVTRSGPTDSALTVSYSVSGTATAGTNYEPLSGSITLAAGQTSATIPVIPIDIGQVGGTATVIVGLSTGSGYVLGPQTGDTVTILENDLPTVALAATQAHATESGTTGTVSVSRNGATTNPLIVLYTIGGTAEEGTDFQPLAGYVTIPAGQTSATITVTPINDPNVESDQTVVLTLADTSQYLVGTQRADTVTIYDDNLPSVTVATTGDANEATGAPGTFDVTRVGPTDNPLTVNYSVGGTAASGTDYAALTGSLTVPAGESTATIDVSPLVDAAPEAEQIVVPSASGGTYTLAIDSDSTEALPYNASAAAVQTALMLLPEVGRGNVDVSGQGTPQSPFIAQFVAGLVGVNVPQITGDASGLTGTTGASVVTTSTGQRGTNQVEQVGYTATSSVSGGTFTLSYQGNSTAALPYNATASAVQSAVAALSGIGPGNVVATALATGPDTYAWQLTFVGALAEDELGPLTTDASGITVTSGSAAADDDVLTWGSPSGGIDAVQQVTISGAVGGTFTLTYPVSGGDPQTTAAIAYDASAADVASALEALAAVGMMNVSVSGNAGGPWTITFVNSLADQPISDLTADGSGLTPPGITTSVSTWADGQRTVELSLAAASAYTIGALDNPTATGGTGASDTATIINNGSIAPTVVVPSYSTNIGQTLTVTAPGVLLGAQDPGGASLSAVLLTGPADGSLTLNADGSFSYAPEAGFQGSDEFVFQAFDGATYSAPAIVTVDVVPVPAPQISLADNSTNIANGGSLDFGQTWVGTPLTQDMTITNSGTADLVLSDPIGLPAGFVLAQDFAATTLAAGATTTFAVELTAAAAGTEGGDLSFAWGDDQNSSAFSCSFTVSGTADTPAPVLEVSQGATVLANGSPSGFSFGTSGEGEPLVQTFQVTNAGAADLVLSDPILLPTGFASWQDFGATTLAPGATTTFSVVFPATAIGTDGGNLTFDWGDSQNSDEFGYTLPISGTVVASPLIAVFDGATQIANGARTDSFGTALVGTALTQSLTIENNGTAALSLDPTQLTLPAGFSVVTPYAASVAPGGSTTLELEIDGSTPGAFSGAVSFPTDDVDNPAFTFQVSGEIEQPEPELEVFDGSTQVTAGTGTVDFGTTQIGSASDVTLTISNVGTADLNVNPVMALPVGYALAAWNGVAGAPPSTIDVPPGSSATATLELLGDSDPNAGGNTQYNGAAAIYSDDPAQQPFDFNLTGTVVAPQAQIALGATAVADETGTVDFGDTPLNTPVIDTFTITNNGPGTLLLTDPIEVPMGFSVVSDFGATTLAAGASTTFAVQLDAETPGDCQGAVIVETNDPQHALYRFNVSGLVATPRIQVSDGPTLLANDDGASETVALADDFGNTPLGTAVERTITLTDTGTGVLTLSDPIDLPSGFTLVSDFGSTTVEPGASTSFTVELTAAAAGFYGGSLSFGTNATLDGSLQVDVSGGVAVPRLDLWEGTTDVTSYVGQAFQPDGTALDIGSTVVGTPRSETFSVTNSGSGELVLSDPIGLPAGFTLTQDFGATTLAPGASTTFTVELTAGTAGDPAGVITFGTNLPDSPSGTAGATNPPGTVGAAFSLPVQGEVIGLTNLRLWNDTGYSATDGQTSDPTVAGNVVGLPSVGSALSGVPPTVTVEFFNATAGGTPTPQGSVTTDGVLPFTFTPPGLVPGPVTIDARLHLVDAVLGDLYTDWTPLSFTLESGTDAAPVVANLALQTVTVPAASTPTSSDATITGSVLHDGNVAYMTVDIDTSGAGQADDTVTTDANGNFVYQPQTLVPGTYTFQFRAVENAYPDGQILGPWEPFTFSLVAPSAPVVDQLGLANPSAPGSTTTLDPTLAGHVTADGNPQQVEVDFNYNGDGTVDDSTTANADGSFTFTPQNLPGGNQTIYVRAVNVDDNLTGAWTTLRFTLLAPQAPSVNTLALLNDTGSSASDKITDDPTVTGTLVAAPGEPDSSVAEATLEFDTNGDGVPDGSTISDDNGNFTWTPSGLAPGTVTIAARAVTTDPDSGDTLLGAWTTLTFTYSTAAGPVVSSLSLAHPTGSDASTGLNTAIDPTLSGTLTNGSGLASFLTVEYDTNGDGTPDGSTITDGQGNFSFTPAGLSVGTDTVAVRGVSEDPQTGQDVDGPWQTITFELQPDVNGQTPTPPSLTDNLTSADEIAATAQQAAVQAIDDALASFNAAAGAGDTPSGLIALGIGSYTALSGDGGGRVASGSIYDVQNGSLPSMAQGGWGGGPGGGSTTGLSGSSPVQAPSDTPFNLASSPTTPPAGSVTVSNQPVSATGTLGPGSSNVGGTLNVSQTITSGPDPGNPNVTDWTIDISISYSYTNGVSGNFLNSLGGLFTYVGTVSGSYSFHYYAHGSTTVTAGGTIYAGIFQIDESSSYSTSWGDGDVTTLTGPGGPSTDLDSNSSSISSGFSHHELGSFSSGGGTDANRGSADAPTLSSDFINRLFESDSFSDGDTTGYSNGSPTGGDVGGSFHSDSLTYAHSYFEMGKYSAWPATPDGDEGGWSIDVGYFADEQSGTASSSDGANDNFSSAAANGQVNGGSNSGDSLSFFFDNFQTGQYDVSPDSFTLSVSYLHYQEGGSQSSFVNQGGGASGSSSAAGGSSSAGGGIASGGWFGYSASQGSSYMLDMAGSYLVNAAGTHVEIDSLAYLGLANDSATYQDGGGYGGQISSAAPSTSASTSASPTTTTLGGSYSDYQSQSDSSMESLHGGFTSDNGVGSGSGLTSSTQASSLSYSSSGGDSSQQGGSNANASGDVWTENGDDSSLFTSSGSYSNGPTASAAGGSYTYLEGAHDSASESGTMSYGSPSNGNSGWQSASESSAFTYLDSGTYSVAGGVGGSSSSDVEGSYSETTLDLSGEGDDSQTNASGAGPSFSNGWTSETQTASSSYSETGTHVNSDASGSFSESDSQSSSFTYTDKNGNVTGSPSVLPGYQNTEASDAGGGWDTSNSSNTGSFSEGSTNTRSASFTGTETTSDSGTATSDNTYTNTARNGKSHNFAASDDYGTTVENGSDYVDNINFNANSNTTSYTQTTTHSETYTTNDAGSLLASLSGTYSNWQGANSDGTETETGVSQTNSAGITTTGSFTDNEISSGADGGGFSQTAAGGPASTSTQATFDYNYVSYTDQGTFTASGAGNGESRTGTFSRTTTQTSTEDDTAGGAVMYGSGTYSNGQDASSKLAVSTSGSFTSANGGVTENGGVSSDETDTADASATQSYIQAGGTWTGHSESSSFSTSQHTQGSGTYTQSGGATTAQDIHYTQDTLTNQSGSTHDESTSNLFAGTPSSDDTIDNSGWTRTSLHKVGESVQNNASNTNTDSGSYRLIQSMGSNSSETLKTTFDDGSGGGTRTQKTTAGASGMSGETGTYSVAQGVSSSSCYYGSATLSNASEDDLEIASALNDPGTSWTSTFQAGQYTNDFRGGVKSVSGSTVTSGTEGFLTLSGSSATRAFNETSDVWQPSASGSVFNDWSAVPWYFAEWKIDDSKGLYGGLAGFAPPYQLGQVSSTVAISETTTFTGTVAGVTTTANGVGGTNSKFSNTTTYDDFAYTDSDSPLDFSQAQPGAAGEMSTGSAQFNETDSSTGSDVNGVVTSKFNKNGSETATYYHFTTTNTTPGPDDNLYQEQDSRSMTTSTSETGSYTTSPPGSAPITPTPDNPGGYAEFNVERKDNVSVSNTISLSVVNHASSGFASETLGVTYTGNANSSMTSDKTTTVDAANNIDTQKGSYSTIGGKGEISAIDRNGSWGSNAYGGTYDFNHFWKNSTSLPLFNGTYPGSAGPTGTITSDSGGGETDTLWMNSPNGHFTWTWTSTIPPSHSEGALIAPGPSQQPADQGPAAPDEAGNGVAPYTPTSSDLRPVNTDSGFIQFWKGIGQGGLNTANGFQNWVVGIANFGINTSPAATLAELAGLPVPQIPVVDWSKGRITQESDRVHWWSSFIGGEAVATGLTAGVGKIASAFKWLGEAVGLTRGGAAGALASRLGWCFPAGTPVATIDGPLPIEQIKVGQRVWAYDVVASEWRGCEVLHTFRREYNGHSTFVTVAGETIESTLLHPYWVVSGEELASRPRREHLPLVPEGATTPGRWVDAGDLRVGDLLLLRDGRMMPVEAVHTGPYHGVVYNFAVAELECYAVGQSAVLVHNTNGPQLVNAAEEVFSQAAFQEATTGLERVGGFIIAGNKGLAGKTFLRNIFELSAEVIGARSPRALLTVFEQEARAAGAEAISIVGHMIVNNKLLNLSPALLKRLGWNIEQINATTIRLFKDLMM